MDQQISPSSGGQQPVPPAPENISRYSFLQIIGLWAAAALPMLLAAWVIAPVLVARLDLPAILAYGLALIAGMAWLFMLALWCIRTEEGSLHWEAVRRQTWLIVPSHPRTGEHRPRLLWRTLPRFLLLLILLFVESLLPLFLLRIASIGRLPMGFLSQSMRAYTQIIELSSPEFAGRWGWVMLTLFGWIFSALLAEEMFFRGVLLPRMAGKGRWLANAALYGVYHLYRPWAIPFRFVEGLLISRPAHRLQSTWAAVLVRSAEGFLILILLLVGAGSGLDPVTEDAALPHITGQPQAARLPRGVLDAVPVYQGGTYDVDLRDYDLSQLDLRSAAGDLWYAGFDTHTTWPDQAQMPPDYNPAEIMELGRNPGLGVRGLHAQGITGEGVAIAIIDQALLVTHQEYASRLVWYEEFGLSRFFTTTAQMHGPAVASIAVGQTTGVAPGADLYYFNGATLTLHPAAQAVRRVIEINQTLPETERIRVISFSSGWVPTMLGYEDMVKAVEEAEEAGILVVSSNTIGTHGLGGLGRFPMADPDVFESYAPGAYWAEQFYAPDPSSPYRVLVPMDSRTYASPAGDDAYTFARVGGISWAIPYAAGVYALAVQVDPDITPACFWSLAWETGHAIQIEHDGTLYTLERIIDPVALIGSLPACPADP